MDRHSIYLNFFTQIGYPPNVILTPPELLSALETLVDKYIKSHKSIISSIFIRVLHLITKISPRNYWTESRILQTPSFSLILSQFLLKLKTF